MIWDVHADAFAHECMTALFVDHGALLVHHVVVFKQVLTRTVTACHCGLSLMRTSALPRWRQVLAVRL